MAGLLGGASRAALLAVALVGVGAVSAVAASAVDPARGAVSSAPAADPMAMDSLLDQAGTDIDLTAVDPADWAPDHAQHAAADVPAAPADKGTPAKPDGLTRDAKLQDAKPQDAKPQDTSPEHKPDDGKAQDVKDQDHKAQQPAKTAAKTTGKTTGKPDADADPEPDGVVVPSAGGSSNDPLDRPRPAKNAVKDAGKPAQPKADAANKPDAAKAPDAKGADPTAAAAKPGAAQPDSSKPAVDVAAQPAEPLPPLNAAIKAALDKREPIKGAGVAEKRKEREAVSFFYAAHGFAPAWSEHDKPIAAVTPVLERLAKAGEDALSVPDVPKALKTDGSAEDKAASDIALTEAVVAYARQASGSRIDPRSISVLIGAKPQLVDPAEVLDSLVAAGPDAGNKLVALNPTDPRYVALREKLTEIRGDREPRHDTDATRIPDGPLLKVGMRDSRVPLLRSRLDVPARGDADDADLLFDADLADAVKAFQREHGIQPLGMVGGRTLTALNGGKAPAAPKTSPKLEGTIVANMEMWRWMPRDMGRERIEVNVPDYQVTVFHDGEPVAKNRVVVGKTDSPTPLFSNTMKYLIVNPVWNVPQSIIKNEFGGGTHGFKARYVHGQMFLQQPAGPGNALGRIKFMFPNDYSVYLHDTPAKHLFSAAKRAYSHGCVRVDKPFEFAESVLNDAVPEGGKILWSQARLEKMLGNSERYVNLPTPLPIHIEYFTASVEDGGRVNLREDVYGYTGAVAAALGYGKSSVPVATYKPPAPAAERKHRYARDDDGYPRRRSRRRDEEYVQAPAAQPSFFMPW